MAGRRDFVADAGPERLKPETDTLTSRVMAVPAGSHCPVAFKFSATVVVPSTAGSHVTVTVTRNLAPSCNRKPGLVQSSRHPSHWHSASESAAQAQGRARAVTLPPSLSPSPALAPPNPPPLSLPVFLPPSLPPFLRLSHLSSPPFVPPCSPYIRRLSLSPVSARR